MARYLFSVAGIVYASGSCPDEAWDEGIYAYDAMHGPRAFRDGMGEVSRSAYRGKYPNRIRAIGGLTGRPGARPNGVPPRLRLRLAACPWARTSTPFRRSRSMR